MLRCIRCNASEKQANLSEHFYCTDTIACITRQEAKSNKVALAASIVNIYFDCACHKGSLAGGQPLGVGIHTVMNGVVQEQWCGTKYIEHGTVSTGEFTALIYALSVALLIRKEHPAYVFRIFGDSQVIIRMFNGEYSHKNFSGYYYKADRLRRHLGLSLLSVTWIPRTKNQEADILSKKAITDYLEQHPDTIK